MTSWRSKASSYCDQSVSEALSISAVVLLAHDTATNFRSSRSNLSRAGSSGNSSKVLVSLGLMTILRQRDSTACLFHNQIRNVIPRPFCFRFLSDFSPFEYSSRIRHLSSRSTRNSPLRTRFNTWEQMWTHCKSACGISPLATTGTFVSITTSCVIFWLHSFVERRHYSSQRFQQTRHQKNSLANL